jgi:tetratricopeptide (TPR) repeat protein
MVNAAVDLQAGKAKEAIEDLEIAERLEKAAEFIPQYLRGLAFIKLDQSQGAICEFDKILSSRGEAPLSSIYPLAQLAKARLTNDKADYEKFFELWKDADKDMPALTAARSEFEALG